MPRGKRPRLDADDVLEGRVRPAVHDLVSLIHDVNPSGHEHLPPAEIAHRYARKSRLQSLLVRRFGGEIDVEPVAGEPYLASLRHRGSGVDACHVVVAELDDDARSWVQRTLDLGNEGSEGGAPLVAIDPEPGPPAVPDLTAAGREAIEAYDYDLARRHLGAALDEGSEEAAAVLVELLVDVLGDDAEALAIASRLPPPAHGRMDVRALLALALARTGDRAAALGLVERLPASGRTAAVFVALARRAVEAGDAGRASWDLAEARRRYPASPELPALAAAIEALRAPLEEKAQRAMAEGRAGEAYAMADEILARFPESKVAARILRRREEERRLESAEKIVRDAEEALVAGALGQARLLLLKARGEGIRAERVAGVEAKIGQYEAGERARVATARVDRVVGLLGKGDPGPGLVGYLGLDAGLRAEVRARAPDPRLGWLDETGVAEGSGARATAAVQAVRALGRAEEVVAGAQPAAAIEILAPHRKALAGVRRAEAILQTAQRALVDEARRRAIAQIEAAEQASASGGEAALRHAERLLSDVRARDLDERGRARFHAVEGRVQAALVRLGRLRKVEEHRRKAEGFDALKAVDELIADVDEPAERDELEALRTAVRAEVYASCEVRVEALPRGTRLRLAGAVPQTPPRSILPGGNEVVLAQTAGHWAFLWVVDVASGEVKERVRLRAEEPIRLQRLVLEAGLLHLIGTTGTHVAIEPSTWQPVLCSTSEVSPDLSTDTALAPGGRYTWVSSGTGGCFDLDIWDNKRGQWARETRDDAREVFLTPLFGVQPARAADPAVPAMAVVRPLFEPSIALHAAHGTQLASHRKMWIVEGSVVVHPAGDTLLAIALAPGQPVRHRVVELDLKASPLPMADPDGRCLPFPERYERIDALVDAGAGLVFLRVDRPEGGHEIIALKTAPRGSPPPPGGTARPFEVIYRVPTAARTILVEDPQGGPALAVACYEDGFTVAPLGPVPPVFRPDAPGAQPFRPGAIRLSAAGGCGDPSGPRYDAITQLGATVFHEPDAVVRARIERARREGPAALLDLVYALDYGHSVQLMTEAAQEGIRAFPDHPEVKLVAARLQIAEKRWDLIRDLLRGVDPTALDPTLTRHLHHLLGLSLVVVGEPPSALEVLRRGEGCPGDCDLGLGLALAAKLDDPAADGRAWSPEDIAVRTLRRAVETGDACLAARDPEGAIRALDTLLVHDLQEVQSLARLAEAYLSIAPDDRRPRGVDPFAEAQSLATFCGAHAETDPFTRCELPLSLPMWDASRLDAIAERARGRLSERPRTARPTP